MILLMKACGIPDSPSTLNCPVSGVSRTLAERGSPNQPVLLTPQPQLLSGGFRARSWRHQRAVVARVEGGDLPRLSRLSQRGSRSVLNLSTAPRQCRSSSSMPR